jgi:hypothetical protein
MANPKIYDDNSGEYFNNEQELREHYLDLGTSEEDSKPPKYVYEVRERKWSGLDIDEFLMTEAENEDMEWEDFQSHLVAVDELRAYIAEWNKKQTLKIYFPDFNKKIKVGE